MENALYVIIGVLVVGSVLADMINTLVTTTNSSWNWWLTRILYRRTWSITQALGRVIKNETRRERFYSVFAPLSILVMLASWVAQQIFGFALIWWGLGDVEGADGFVDALYYSGVVFFTVGFGEVIPVGDLSRFGALIEAFFGVLTVALVIGYIPALYSAYSAREQKLLTLDDGTEERITPTNLVLSQCPNADPERLEAFFSDWEGWVAHVLETHVTFPMLSLFRSQHPGQSWITALGLVTDAALHMELIEGQQAKSAYWLIRRSARLLHALTEGADVSDYRAQLDSGYDTSNEELFRELYGAMENHGFQMIPYDEALTHSQELRRTYDAQLEYLIDRLEAPRGFWGHEVGHKLKSFANEGVPDERWRG